MDVWADLAQSVEQQFCKLPVVGSIPIVSSIFGEIPEWSKGSDCKSDGSAFEGSNPSLATIFQFCFSSGCSSVGRAPAFQAGGREFEPHRPLHFFSSLSKLTWLSGRALPW